MESDIKRAAENKRPVGLGYTRETDEAATRYFNEVSKGHFHLPSQFNWGECFAAMLSTAPPAGPDARVTELEEKLARVMKAVEFAEHLAKDGEHLLKCLNKLPRRIGKPGRRTDPGDQRGSV